LAIQTEVVVDIGKLARELADLGYESGYRFENGMPYCERLSEEGIRAVLSRLQERGYAIVQDNSSEVKSPALFAVEPTPRQPAR
jgi:hypothetical protein